MPLPQTSDQGVVDEASSGLPNAIAQEGWAPQGRGWSGQVGLADWVYLLVPKWLPCPLPKKRDQ